MDKAQLIEKISKGNYDQEKLLSWVKCLPSNSMNRKPSVYKQGDVLMHPIFQHPYILLKKNKDVWICGLMTSNEDFPDNISKCESRFFEGSFLTKTLFVTSEIKGTFLNNYDNNSHLREVITQLKKELKL